MQDLEVILQALISLAVECGSSAPQESLTDEWSLQGSLLSLAGCLLQSCDQSIEMVFSTLCAAPT